MEINIDIKTIVDFVKKKLVLIRSEIIVTEQVKTRPAHQKCSINVTHKQSKFIPFVFHNFSKNDCHQFFEKLVDKKKDSVKFDIIPKTNEEYISKTYGCIRFFDSYRFLSRGLFWLVKKLSNDDLKILKKGFPDNCNLLKKKLAIHMKIPKKLSIMS